MTEFASLCVLSYERPELLIPSLESLTENAGHPFELIVHDDGSANPELREHLHRLHADGALSTLIVNRPGHNQGQGTALNRMFGMAAGDPIVKLDQDLVYRPGWLRRAVEILHENKNRSSSAPADGGQGEPLIGMLGLLHYYREPVDSRKTQVAAWEGWTQHTHLLGSAFALTRDCWDELGPFTEHSEAFDEDARMQLRVHGSGSYVVALPPEDLVENIGMGYGPSVVNAEPGKMQRINHGPFVIGLT